jgi:hypothetical protein
VAERAEIWMALQRNACGAIFILGACGVSACLRSLEFDFVAAVFGPPSVNAATPMAH